MLEFGRPWLLIIVGLLFARGLFLAVRRRRDHRRWSPSVPRQALRRTYTSRSWWTRFGAVLFGALGVLSLNASATFQVVSSATASAHTITVASMKLTAGMSGARDEPIDYRRIDARPGDQLQRSLDLTVSAGTTTGAMTGITLQAGASPSSLLDSNSGTGCGSCAGVPDRRRCDGLDANGTRRAPWTYSCGGGGTLSDNLNAGAANPIPAANTCANTSSGTVTGGSTYRALSELASAYTLTNLPLTSSALVPGTVLHFVITMCFPTATGNTYSRPHVDDDLHVPGVQRAGLQK